MKETFLQPLEAVESSSRVDFGPIYRSARGQTCGLGELLLKRSHSASAGFEKSTALPAAVMKYTLIHVSD